MKVNAPNIFTHPSRKMKRKRKKRKRKSAEINIFSFFLIPAHATFYLLSENCCRPPRPIFYFVNFFFFWINSSSSVWWLWNRTYMLSSTPCWLFPGGCWRHLLAGPDRGPFARHSTRDWPLLDATRLKTQEPAALFHLPFNIALNILFLWEKKPQRNNNNRRWMRTIGIYSESWWITVGFAPATCGFARPVYPPYFSFVIFLGDV